VRQAKVLCTLGGGGLRAGHLASGGLRHGGSEVGSCARGQDNAPGSEFWVLLGEVPLRWFHKHVFWVTQ